MTDETDIKKPDVYVLSSGGTGGHLFPALSLSKEIAHAGHTALLVTDTRGAHFYKKVDVAPHLLCTITRTHWLFGKLVYPFSLATQLVKCFIWLLMKKPKAVVGFGGYPSFPCVFAAQLLGIQTYIHEGNAFLGKANRFLSKRAIKIGVSFPLTPEQEADGRYHLIGMPVRREFSVLTKHPYEESINDQLFYLLVVGGSQGAKIFGTVVPQAIALLPFDYQKRLVVTQQCREAQIPDVKQTYKSIACQKNLTAFITNIDFYYKTTHLVITRAGASTVAEIAMAGRPALFVPYAGSVEGDQARNAEHIQDANAAWVMKECSFTPERLSEFLKWAMDNPKDLSETTTRVKDFACPNATHRLWEMVQGT